MDCPRLSRSRTNPPHLNIVRWKCAEATLNGDTSSPAAPVARILSWTTICRNHTHAVKPCCSDPNTASGSTTRAGRDRSVCMNAAVQKHHARHRKSNRAATGAPRPIIATKVCTPTAPTSEQHRSCCDAVYRTGAATAAGTSRGRRTCSTVSSSANPRAVTSRTSISRTGLLHCVSSAINIDRSSAEDCAVIRNIQVEAASNLHARSRICVVCEAGSMRHGRTVLKDKALNVVRAVDSQDSQRARNGDLSSRHRHRCPAASRHDRCLTRADGLRCSDVHRLRKTSRSAGTRDNQTETTN